MKSMIKFMVLATITLPILASCSGGGSSSSSSSSSTPLFGSLAGEYAKYAEKRAEIEAKAKNITTEAEKAKLVNEAMEMQDELSVKIEEAAKSLDGKTVEVEAGDFKVTEPISLTFEKFYGSDLEAIFKVNGKAEAANEIDTGDYVLSGRVVNIVGYDADGNKLYSAEIGTVAVTNRDGKGIIAAGTPVKLSSVRYSDKYVEEYQKASTLKLELK